MNCVPLAIDGLERNAALYGRLMAGSAGLPNDAFFAKMIASQACGASALPAGLGLYPEVYAKLLARHFPALMPGELAAGRRPEERRLTERRNLIDLLLEYRTVADPSEVWMAQIIAAACLGGDRLWQDLGLGSRDDLTRLMTGNFHYLAVRNGSDMKWKKFLYRLLCEREGIHVCPSPSCQVCSDHGQCFGPE